MATRARKKVNKLTIQEAIKEMKEYERTNGTTNARYLTIRKCYPSLNTANYG